jgi:hypothetical protein
MNYTRVMNPKEFIKTVFVDELKSLIDTKPYISFMIISIGIEYLGKCINKEISNWQQEGKSKKNFEKAILEIPSLKKYSIYLEKYKFYDSFRCGLVHAASPKFQITFSREGQTNHLEENNKQLNLKIEDFFKDFEDACNYVIELEFSHEDKMNQGFLSIPSDNFNNRTFIKNAKTSSLE